jgi:hypothetical protein
MAASCRCAQVLSNAVPVNIFGRGIIDVGYMSTDIDAKPRRLFGRKPVVWAMGLLALVS